MFKKGLIGKFGNVAKFEFEDKREQAIYNLGVDAGERQAAIAANADLFTGGGKD